MRHLSIGILAAALAAAPLSAASAHGFRHHGFGLIGGLFHAAGAVVVGAATIATAPIAIIANAGRHGDYDGDRDGYYRGRYGDGYGPPRDGYCDDRGVAYRRYSYDAPPPAPYYARGAYDSYDRNSYGYDDPRDADGPPPYYRQPYDGPRGDEDRYARRDPYYDGY